MTPSCGGPGRPTGGPTSSAAAAETIRLRPTFLTDAQRRRYPHLWNYTALRVDPADRGRVAAAVRGQVVVTARDADGTTLAATGVQLPGVLDDLYPRATGAHLGPTFSHGRVTLSVWAPTAQGVALEFRDGPQRTVAMRRDDSTGVWSASGDWTGRAYRYRVTAWQPAAQKVVTASVTDPYSTDLTVDSTWSRATDLADPALAPAGWAKLRKRGVPPSKIQVQEHSVRDFSIADATVPAAQRGTYLAFAGDGAGMKHLRAQASAGLTHVHLLPVFDFATIPERRADQATPGL